MLFVICFFLVSAIVLSSLIQKIGKNSFRLTKDLTLGKNELGYYLRCRTFEI